MIAGPPLTDTELPLKGPQLLRHGRLRDAEGGSGACEMLRLRH